MGETMNLSRSRNGTMIHKRDCKYAANGLPWLWADDKSHYDVLNTCLYFGYQTCMSCKPLPGDVVRKMPKGFVI